MLRFALLRHECPADYRDGPHWDLMLELPYTAAEHRLATWSLLELPAAWGRALGLPAGLDAVDATKLDDHRAWYLDNEGPLSGDRGFVRRVAGGSLEWEAQSEAICTVRLLEPGELSGRAVLQRVDATANWRLTVDPPAGKG